MTLELGGKSANVIFADADLAAAAAAAPLAVFGNAGQDCCARSRILVERSAMDDFMAELEREVKGMRVGDPLAEDTVMGPLISAGQRSDVADYVPDDAPVAIRGSAPDGPGFWFPPTVLAPMSNSDRGRDRGDLRAGRLRHPLRRRGRGDRARQRHDVRPLGVRLDPRRRARHARRPRHRGRRRLRQLEHLGAGDDPVRRLQAERLRPRARARARSTPTRRKRTSTSRRTAARRRADGWTPRGEGLRDHRRRRRDRRRERRALRRRGGPGGGHRPDEPRGRRR